MRLVLERGESACGRGAGGRRRRDGARRLSGRLRLPPRSGELRHVLITGGAGFVGTNLVAGLSEGGGYQITVLDDESLGDRSSVEDFGVRFVKGDIRDRAVLDDVLAGQDVVVHLAADTRVIDSIAEPAHNFDVNVVGSFRLLEACRAAGVNRVVAASTGGAILGEAPPPVHEELPAHPTSPYGASKLAMEGYLSAFAGAYGMATCGLRFSNIYGPRSFRKGSVVALFYKQLLAGEELVVYGDGSQTRDFLYSGDLVDGIRRAIELEAMGVYQLGSGRPTTVNELLAVIAEVTGRGELPVRYEDFRAGEIHTSWCDVTKAREGLGFDPRTPLHDGLAATWKWFVERQAVVLP